jgi:hypothetical protein
MQYEERLTKILEHIISGVFTIEDAKDFIEIKKANTNNYLYPMIRLIYIGYLTNLLPPAFPSFSFEILEILEKEKKPLSYKELCKKVKDLYSINFDREKKFHFDWSLDILVKPKLTRYQLVNKEGKFFAKYTLTNEGRVAYLLLNYSIESLLQK